MNKVFKKGFTLLEILVVLSIIGIILSFVVPNVINRPDEARRAKVLNDINVIESALNLYKLDNGDYPAQELGLKVLALDSKYITNLPLDPWGNPYRYRYPGKFNSIDIFTLGSDNEEGGEKNKIDIGNWINDTEEKY